MTAPALDLARPTVDVATAAAYLGVSPALLYRELQGDLAHLVLRVGARVLVKTAALRELVEAK